MLGTGTSSVCALFEGCQVLLYRFRLAAPSCPDFSQEPPARRSCTRRRGGSQKLKAIGVCWWPKGAALWLGVPPCCEVRDGIRDDSQLPRCESLPFVRHRRRPSMEPPHWRHDVLHLSLSPVLFSFVCPPPSSLLTATARPTPSLSVPTPRAHTHTHTLTSPVLPGSSHPHTRIPTADMSSSTAQGPDPTKLENMERDKAGEGGEQKENAAGMAGGVVSILVKKLVRAISSSRFLLASLLSHLCPPRSPLSPLSSLSPQSCAPFQS